MSGWAKVAGRKPGVGTVQSVGRKPTSDAPASTRKKKGAPDPGLSAEALAQREAAALAKIATEALEAAMETRDLETIRGGIERYADKIPGSDTLWRAENMKKELIHQAKTAKKQQQRQAMTPAESPVVDAAAATSALEAAMDSKDIAVLKAAVHEYAEAAEDTDALEHARLLLTRLIEERKAEKKKRLKGAPKEAKLPKALKDEIKGAAEGPREALVASAPDMMQEASAVTVTTPATESAATEEAALVSGAAFATSSGAHTPDVTEMTQVASATPPTGVSPGLLPLPTSAAHTPQLTGLPPPGLGPTPPPGLPAPPPGLVAVSTPLDETEELRRQLLLAQQQIKALEHDAVAFTRAGRGARDCGDGRGGRGGASGQHADRAFGQSYKGGGEQRRQPRAGKGAISQVQERDWGAVRRS